MANEINYSPETSLRLNGHINEEEWKEGTVITNLSNLDISQSHHFTVSLGGFNHYKTPGAPYSKYLPVKSISLNFTSYENASIPLAIFGDFPLLNKKRVSTISLTCYDMDNNILEKQLIDWENQCFPQNKFVAYMEDIARELIYRGYDVKGKQNVERRLYVIPAGNVSVSRDYSANDAKLISFSLIAVGNGVNSSTGNAKAPHAFEEESLLQNAMRATSDIFDPGYVGGGIGGGGGSSW